MSEKVDQIMSELKKKVKLDVAAIGVGFAGSYNVQKLNEALGIPAFVINSSVKDLSDSIIKKDIPSFIIGSEGRGAGNDRVKSKKMFKINGKELFTTNDTFLNLLKENDIIFIVFSSAGGTGSGTGPELVKLCRKQYPNKIIIPIVISPRKADSTLSQYNNIECVNEIDALEGPYIIGDLEYFASDKEDVAYEKMSEWVLENVRKISGMDYELTNAGMMDEQDLTTVISEPGYLAQYTIPVSQKILEGTDIQSLLIKKISDSPAMLIQKDKHVKWGGLVINLPNDIDDVITTGDLSIINNAVGVTKHTYKNFSSSRNATGYVTIILSGLSLPYNRLSESTEKVKEFLAAQEKTSRNISLSNDLAGLNAGFGGFTEKVVENNEDVLDDYFD